MLQQPEFLPITPQELHALGWDSRLDILLVSGDAYVDHPSFAMALLGRWLVAHGFTVAILPQPKWQGEDAVASFTAFPRPRLFAGVSAGAIDSMLAHSTAFRKKRHDDAYTPGGKTGARPDRASIVYTGLVRRAFPGLPVVLGGLEASLRRFSHYDFWTDSLRRSLLLDSKADILLSGMGEHNILTTARLARKLVDSLPQDDFYDSLPEGKKRDYLRKLLAEKAKNIPGAVTALSANAFSEWQSKHGAAHILPSHEEILQDKRLLVTATMEHERIVHQATTYAAQRSAERFVLMAPPDVQQETGPMLDSLYDLPFTRLPHPSYKEAIPAWEMIRTSITTHRGCGGGCSFCSLALHQGRALRSRSKKSILQEAAGIASGTYTQNPAQQKVPKWAGSISDVGGPSANMWQGSCTLNPAKCTRSSCLHPKICPGFKMEQTKCVELLHAVQNTPGVNHVRVASGVRFDMAVKDMAALKAYSMDFTGGQLKVAPEHTCPDILAYMRKPTLEVFEEFLAAFERFSKAAGKKQFVVAYLISAFPGCTEAHMHKLKSWLAKRGWSPKQVQCFIPTPGTVATAMYYAECDAEGRPIPVAKTDAARMKQHYILLK